MVLAGVVAALTAAALPSASAGVMPDIGAQQASVMANVTTGSTSNAWGDHLDGGCLVVAVNQLILTNGIFLGVIGDASVATNFSGTPTGATVTCFITVNGVEAPGTRHGYSGNEAEAKVDRIAVNALDGDSVAECETALFDDGSTLPLRCTSVIIVTAPPQIVFDEAAALGPIVDPTVCPILISIGGILGGNVLGVVRISADGDVYAPPLTGTGLDRIYDCPPY